MPIYGIGSANSPATSPAASSASTTQTVGSQAQSTAKTAGSKLDMNAFLNMFVTQLKYQDPTNPLESYELASQLAQFSSVEKLTEVNSNLTEIQSYLSSLNNAQMINLIGKEVEGPSGTLIKKDGEPTKLSYTMSAPADVTAKIYDDEGKLVRTIQLGTVEAGSHELSWDGKNDAGEDVANGTYHCSLDGTDGAGKPLEIATTVSGTVYSFRLENGIPYLILNGADGVKLPVSNIQEVRNPSAEA